MAKVRLRETSAAGLGSVLLTRHASSTIAVCHIANEEDMPFCATLGVKPDVIISPLFFSGGGGGVGDLLEMFFGKSSILQGGLSCCNSSSVGCTNLLNSNEFLVARGYHSSGKEVMYDGCTGCQMEGDIFIGPAHYSLCVGAEDERTTPLGETRSFGMSEVLHDAGKMVDLSVCAESGMIVSDKPHHGDDGDGDGGRRRRLHTVSIPESTKSMIQHLTAINLQVRLIAEDVNVDYLKRHDLLCTGSTATKNATTIATTTPTGLAKRRRSTAQKQELSQSRVDSLLTQLASDDEKAVAEASSSLSLDDASSDREREGSSDDNLDGEQSQSEPQSQPQNMNIGDYVFYPALDGVNDKRFWKIMSIDEDGLFIIIETTDNRDKALKDHELKQIVQFEDIHKPDLNDVFQYMRERRQDHPSGTGGGPNGGAPYVNINVGGSSSSSVDGGMSLSYPDLPLSSSSNGGGSFGGSKSAAAAAATTSSSNHQLTTIPLNAKTITVKKLG